MVYLSKSKQVLFAKESNPGVAETLTSADALLRVIDVSFDPQFDNTENNEASPSFSVSKPRIGQRTSRATFSFLLAGRSDQDDQLDPPFNLLLEAAGFLSAPVQKITLDAGAFTSGTVLKSGQIFTATGSGAKGIIVGSVFSADTAQRTLRYIPYDPSDNGSPTPVDSADTDIVVNSTNNDYDATVDITTQTPADGGIGYLPLTKPQAEITIGAPSVGDSTFLKGDIIKGASSKAVGICAEEISGAGTLKYNPVIGNFTNGEILADVSADGDSTIATTSSGPSVGMFPTLTLWGFEDALRYKMRGCIVEQVEFQQSSGAQTIVQIQVLGILDTPDDQSPFDVLISGSAAAPRFMSADTAAADYSGTILNWDFGRLASFNVRIANEVSPRENAAKNGGIEVMVSGGRAVTVTHDAEVVPETTFKNFDKAVNLTKFRVRAGYGESGNVGNYFVHSFDDLTLNGLSTQDRAGKLAYNHESQANGEIDDEYAFVVY